MTAMIGFVRKSAQLMVHNSLSLPAFDELVTNVFSSGTRLVCFRKTELGLRNQTSRPCATLCEVVFQPLLLPLYSGRPGVPHGLQPVSMVIQRVLAAPALWYLGRCQGFCLECHTAIKVTRLGAHLAIRRCYMCINNRVSPQNVPFVMTEPP